MRLSEHPDFRQAIVQAAEHFAEHGLRFSTSDALFPPAALSATIGAEYEIQCRQLCFGAYPTWPDVLGRFAQLRERL